MLSALEDDCLSGLIRLWSVEGASENRSTFIRRPDLTNPKSEACNALTRITTAPKRRNSNITNSSSIIASIHELMQAHE